MKSPERLPQEAFEWPHAPVHRLSTRGAYMVTGATYRKQLFFQGRDRLELVFCQILKCAAEFQWDLQAWAVLANHYHFVAISPEDPKTLSAMIGKIHAVTARTINKLDAVPGRKVWHQYWDSLITFDGSYLARLHYVQSNPVRHGVATIAENYRWCSAGWFARTADRAFYKTVTRMAIDQVNVIDDF